MKGIFMATNIKQPTTIEQQITQLKERGMIVDNEKDLEQWLKTVGYYRLSGYWWVYEQRYPDSTPRNHIFKEGTSWLQVKYTYIFDQKFRRILSTGIEKIEIAVKASWAQYLSTHYNTSHPHEDPAIFNSTVCQPRHSTSDNKTAFDKLIDSYQSSKEPFALHYKQNYQNISTPPIWVSSLLLTLGELLNWIKGIKRRSDKRAIFMDFPFDYKPMQSILNNLRWVRNVCAHNGRLWNKRSPIVFISIRSLDDRLIRSSANNNELDNKIYNTIVAMAEILKTIDPDFPFTYFIKDLIIHSKYINVKLMGFPDDWENRPEWKSPTPLPKHIITKRERRNKRRIKRNNL